MTAWRGIVCLGLGLTTVLAGCTGAGMSVASAYGPGIKFTGFGATYDWWPGDSTSAAIKQAHPDADRIIRELLADKLATKGYLRRTTGQPDLWVDYGVHRKTRGGLREASWQPVYEEGTLVIDILDPATGKHIWRGYAQAKVDEADSPAEREKRVREAIGLILDRFPSRGQ